MDAGEMSAAESGGKGEGAAQGAWRLPRWPAA